ncbi:MAG: glycoside hydrolase family 3 protein [Thermoprotei archaeon]
MAYIWERARKEIYRDGWIDHNKNGIKDPYEDPSLPIDARVDDLLSRMSLEDKLRELRSSFIASSLAGNLSTVLRSLEPRQAAETANEIQRRFLEETPLGIPTIIHDECLHGCMAKYSTVFPQAIALAATWNPALVGEVASLIAREARKRGIRQCLSPVLNLVLDQRAGRTEESFGEDPTLASRIAFEYVSSLAREKVIATPKHFIMNFVGEGGRDSAEVHASERFVREGELVPFYESFRAGALSVMAAYNSLDGVPCSSNSWLLTELLRHELAFQGFVVSDYGSVAGVIYKHRVAKSEAEASAMALRSGLDVELPDTRLYGEPLEEALKNGLVSEKEVDRAVRRVLRAKFAIGLFDDPYVNPSIAEQEEKGARELAYRAAAESIVLLKNDGLLPIDRVSSILLVGRAGGTLNLGGYSGIPRRAETILDALSREASKRGILLSYEVGPDPDMDANLTIPSTYLSPPEGDSHGLQAEYLDSSGRVVKSGLVSRWEGFARFDWGYEPPVQGLSQSYTVKFTGFIDVPLDGEYLFRVTSEGGESSFRVDDHESPKLSGPRSFVSLTLNKGRHRFELTYSRNGYGYAYLGVGWETDQRDSISRVKEAAAKHDLIILTASLHEGEGRDRAGLGLSRPQREMIEEVMSANKNTAVILFGGSAVTGDWIDRARAVVQAWYPGQESSALAAVLFGEEDPGGRLPFTWPLSDGQLPLYHYERPSGRVRDYVNLPSTPRFSFGHGLSYANFSYEGAVLQERKNGWTVRVKVSNTSNRRGKCVVQMYVRYPSSAPSSPLLKLKDFKKVELQGGSSAEVELTLDLNDLAIYGAEMRRYVPAGSYDVLIGNSASDLRISLKLELEREVRANASVEDKGNGKVIVSNAGPIDDLVPLELLVGGQVRVHRLYLRSGETRKLRIDELEESS